MSKGLLFCALLTLLGFGLAKVPFIATSGVSPLVFALLLGIIVGNLPIRKTLEIAQPGLAFATRWLLRGGIVLFGLSLTFTQVLDLGPKVLLLDALVITSILIAGYMIGTRLLGMDRETTLLTCAGSAICGAAAVLATESTIRSRPAAASMAVATVVLFGSLAMLLYPMIYPWLGMNEGLFGVYIGATIHEVAQVVAAGDAVGPTALANAVIVKLVRVMLLVPFLLIVGQWWLHHNVSTHNVATSESTDTGQVAEKGKLVIPWFALGFIVMVGVNSLEVIPAGLHDGLVLLGQLSLTMAMAALGLNTRMEKLKALGVKPFLLALILFMLLIIGGGAASWMLMG
ncbi:YeiH family protein [Halomonas binhaiensis]|uniref:YeiH family putative sulfate export transporter n=1 Tax=Halomonas binhaiensis TaxID=2562282 RepID=A0A5C1NKG5_9GAMM|nr:YeiH family protein [Halomonas binhaiensis]QEM82877.1 YeiH family putative sulfate export transporter [Halomonas binhaiensis]